MPKKNGISVSDDNFWTCDHPELLTKDNLCHLCNELDGQLDLLEEIQ